MNPKAQKSTPMKRGSEAVLGFAAKSVATKKKQSAAGGKKGGGGSTGDRLAGRTGTARIVPPGTEVLLVVAPKQPELMVSGAGGDGAGLGGAGVLSLASFVCVCGLVLIFFALFGRRSSSKGTSPRPFRRLRGEKGHRRFRFAA